MLLDVLKVVEQFGPQVLLWRRALLHGLPHHHGLLLLLEVIHFGECSDRYGSSRLCSVQGPFGKLSSVGPIQS